MELSEDSNQPLQNLDLSFNGQWSRAPEKKFQEVVLLVPFWGGKKKNLRRHAELLNRLGFDCILFNLNDDFKNIATQFVSSKLNFGMKRVWADQIEALLNEIGGPKIVFSFSNPSASAIEAIARRSATDVTALICDSGPSGQFWSSMVNFFTFERPLPLFPLKAAAATAISFLWHPQFAKAIQQDLKAIPSGFRILSIRGWKDKLISPQMIDQVFEPNPHLDWQKLSLPQAGHLNGLKDFAEDYEPAVTQFLIEVATPLELASPSVMKSKLAEKAKKKSPSAKSK
jgi:pimeloyl-ACP methyl ester carboxylesterase